MKTSLKLHLCQIAVSACFVGCALSSSSIGQEEYGSIQGIDLKHDQLAILPFASFMLKESRVANTTHFYPQEGMNIALYELLKGNDCNIVYPDSSKGFFRDTLSDEFNASFLFSRRLIGSVLRHPDSLNLWRPKDTTSLLGSRTYFYWPLNFERIRNGDHSSTLYVIVGNCKGEIVYVRALAGYNPTLWAKDWMYFMRDIEHRIPFGL